MLSHNVLRLENCLDSIRMVACGFGFSTFQAKNSSIDRLQLSAFLQCECITSNVSQRHLGSLVVLASKDQETVGTSQLADKVLHLLVGRQCDVSWQIRHSRAFQEELLQLSVTARSSAIVT